MGANDPEEGCSPTKSAAVNSPENIALAELTRRSTTDELGLPSTQTSPASQSIKWRTRLHLATFCLTMFLLGWNDGSLGPLIPRIQSAYHVNFLVVSLIFVSNCVGIIVGVLLNVYLTKKFGFGKIISLGSLVALATCCIQAPAPPFPVFVLSYALGGFGTALQEAHSNGYILSLKNPSSRLGLAHSFYGVGSLVAPFLATKFAQLPRWSFQYLASAGISFVNAIMLAAVFRLRSQDECMAEIGESPGESDTSHDNLYLQIFRRKSIHFFGLFMFAYVGVFSAIGGWIVSYVINVRSGGPSSGYISSGFFGGIALGPLSLLWLTQKLGNRKAVLLYMILSIGLELIVWLVPSLITGGVCISLIGLILGPIYPITMNEASKVLPRWLITSAMGWLSAFAMTGSAVVPFAAGLLAQEKGLWTLQPLLVSMMTVMVGLWIIIPRTHEHSN
ncbi:MFS general substrate transporter [Gloeopeniophorella convolvens]|nr:MFS general substrate transporter [Gloeopeniophorella convolvens]